MRIYKKSFITIPDAPNYEINGYFKIRNKTTGRLVKNRSRDTSHAIGSVTLIDATKEIKHFGVEKLYRRALAAALNEDSEWALIGLANNLYEMNWDGVVRNVKTKQIVKPRKGNSGNYYLLSIYGNGRTKSFTFKRLFNDAFYEKYTIARPNIPVYVRKDGLAYYFESIKSAARFLKAKVFWSMPQILKLMRLRKKNIYGYEITYLR